ncbi:TIGR02680 family protein [Spiractinospora alimapuensis]|uniref:TIGR02680 family protein n=1 Tax=Spiractinospora alimapuensis TaxID=2820884 RepID=UPI001F1A6697|nr:TIGR02680 family protein [Spiractinospora alimapuensis]QVQ51015.1 TIGR02680 family protein [Spiractinospora alimapuensis]
MTDAPAVDTSPQAARYRLNRAGIHNVWQYDNQVFHFADGRLLLRGRNGAGKSKALEVLLPFLLDGDARRLDTAGNGRTTLRWLLRGAKAATGVDDEGVVLGHAWVEFARQEDDAPHHLTLGAAVSSASDEEEARCLFYVTPRRVGEDLTLVRDGRPLPADEVRAELGEDNTFTSPAQYRARVMDELFGLEDPRRYRNLVHLLYRLRRPTIGERLEGGELATVLAEALPPTDEVVLDTVGRNLTDLEAARAHLVGLQATRDHIAEFLEDYRGYLHGVIRGRTRAVRTQLEDHTRRTDEVERLAAELATLVSAESSAQEDRDRVRRTRDTADGDGSVLETAAETAEDRDRRMVINAFIRTARAAWHAAEYARAAEENAQDSLAKGVATLNEQLESLHPTAEALTQGLRDAGLPPDTWGEIPQTDPTVLAPRESTTAVDLEGLEHAVERAPVPGVDAGALRGRLARLHDELAECAQQTEGRDTAAASLLEVLDTLGTAHTTSDALSDEAEWADRALTEAHERHKAAEERLVSARGEYVERVHQWCERLRGIVVDPELGTALAPMIDRMRTRTDAGQLTPDDETDTAIRGVVAPHLEDLRDRRDVAVGEARELRVELDELAERRTALEKANAEITGEQEHGLPLYQAVEFAGDLSDEEQAAIEAGLEGSGLLTAYVMPDGSVVDTEANRLLLSPRPPLSGPTLFDVLRPREHSAAGVSAATIAELLTSVSVEGLPPERTGHGLEPGGQATPAAECAISVTGHWRLGVLSGTGTKTAPELVGERARSATRERDLAKLDRRIAIAEALLAEARERCTGLENQTDDLATTLASAPTKVGLAGAAAIADQARADHEAAREDASAAAEAARVARQEVLELTKRVNTAAEEHSLPDNAGELTATRNAIHRARTHLSTLRRDLAVVARRVEDYRAAVGAWEEQRRRRISAEDFRTQAIQEMIQVRRQIELTERARSAHPDQLAQAREQVRERGAEAGSRLPELERTAQRARDERVAAEARLAMARAEQAEQARRVLRVGRGLRKAFARPDAGVGLDRRMLTATGLDRIAGGLQAATIDTGDDDSAADLGHQVRQLAAFTAAVEAGLPESGDPVDDSAILRRHDELQQRLAKAGAHARSRLTERNSVKRVLVEAGRDECDIIEYAERLDADITEAQETASLREEEAYERHLLGEMAGHLGQQIEESKSLVATMNALLGRVTTSQGLGVRLDWTIAADADEDIRAVVPLLERPPEQRTRLETTRLRDALRRCIEAIRRLDPGSTQGAQLRAALDYRSWFDFTVYVTDTRSGGEERRLSHRTGLSQGEQRVVAYLVLFAAAAAEFSALGRRSDRAPRLILLDDAFAKVDEPTHGRLLGLLSELDLDFVLTSERLWGCFPSVPSLEIYECLRDPEVPGISTMRFSWDGTRRSLQD